MNKYNPTKKEKEMYLLKEDRDIEILGKCRALQKKKLRKEDKLMVDFILTQLYDDWRKLLLAMVDKLIKKYKRD